MKTLIDRYQIPREFNPHLLEAGEWCCSPSSGLEVYASYLLAGLRFPLNSFCRDLLHRLGIGPNQLNPNGLRTIVAMQVLWHEALEGNRPITVDEFLYCYKLSEEDVIYSCAPEVASTLDAAKLKTLIDRYQIPREFNPRLPEAGE